MNHAGISYTFGADAPPALRGKHCTGGYPAAVGGIRVVRFCERVDGKSICARIKGRTELEQAVAEYEKAQAEAKERQQAELDHHVPGLNGLKAAEYAAEAEIDRYKVGREHMMEREDGCCQPPRKPDPEIIARRDEMRARYPRAAEWYRCQLIIDGTSWADNTGRGREARERQQAIERGE